MSSDFSSFELEGYLTIPSVIESDSIRELLRSLPDVASSGTRTLLSSQVYSDFAAYLRDSSVLAPVLSGLVAVEGIYFVKSNERNWSVRTHRDTIVPVNGTGPWKPAGTKEGMRCARAPLDFIRQCVAVRVSLDWVPEGDISVVPGSHVDESSGEGRDSTPLIVPVGGAIALRPSLLHSSTKLTSSNVRRVLHFLYAPRNVPENYGWYHAA